MSLLSVLNKENYSAAIGLLDRLAGRTDSAGRSWMTLLFEETFLDDDFRCQLARAARRSNTTQAIVEMYELVIQTKRSEDQIHINLLLQFYLGTILWNWGSLDEQDTAMEMWEEIISHKSTELLASYASIFAAQRLDAALLARSRGKFASSDSMTAAAA